MSNAVLYFHTDAYDTTGKKLMGRHAAGESFLRGFLRHGQVDDFHLWNTQGRPIEELEALVRRIEPPPRDRKWHKTRRRIGDVGVLSMPVPGIGGEAWMRRPLGDGAYAISGITHTTATAAVMQNISDLLLAPLHDYDALICTSNAVRGSVEVQLDGVREHLSREYGPRRRPEPQRVTIPLGINTADFSTSHEQRKAWRERLQIPDDAIVALYLGRFDAQAKMNPALMAAALEQAASRTSRPLYWVNAGWAVSEEAAAQYEQQTRLFCPSVQYRRLDGRPADVRFSIWSVADFFISFSDNIQETFGLTPIEAMAAGLPCVVTDWDGYRDTVRDGEDGFRIATYAPRPGDGGDLAYAFADNRIEYGTYVGAASQFTAIDFAAAADAIVALAENEELRRRMGASARAQAQTVFDWAAIIPQYQALWAEQDARRRATALPPSEATNPFRPDPFTLFGGYPTHHFGPDWRVSAMEGLSWTDLEARFASTLASHSGVHRPSLPDAQAMFEWLAANGPATAAEVAAQFAPGVRPFMQRGLLWLARFGAVVLKPPA